MWRWLRLLSFPKSATLSPILLSELRALRRRERERELFDLRDVGVLISLEDDEPSSSVTFRCDVSFAARRRLLERCRDLDRMRGDETARRRGDRGEGEAEILS